MTCSPIHHTLSWVRLTEHSRKCPALNHTLRLREDGKYFTGHIQCAMTILFQDLKRQIRMRTPLFLGAEQGTRTMKVRAFALQRVRRWSAAQSPSKIPPHFCSGTTSGCPFRAISTSPFSSLFVFKAPYLQNGVFKFQYVCQGTASIEMFGVEP